MEYNCLRSAVSIKTDDEIYLYPRKRGKSQCLIKVDKIGFDFWKLLNQEQNIDEVVRKVCKQYKISDEEMKRRVNKDVLEFIEMLKGVGLYVLSQSEGAEKVIEKRVSEKSFAEQFSKVQAYYSNNRMPYKFFIELTYNCNLRCKHCYRSEDVKDSMINKVYLDKRVVCHLLDEIEEMGGVEVIFTGGEPFLHPDIYEILEYASCKNLVISVLSNGNFLSDIKEVEKLRSYEIFDIRVSLYGMQKCHDELTMVSGSFRKSICALENICKVLKIGTAAVVVTKENYEECEILISKLVETGINVAVNSSITPTARGNIAPLNLRITPVQYEKLIEKYNLPLTGTNCTAGISRFRINPNGDVTPCELIPEYKFGNIYTKSLYDIINGEDRMSFVDMFEKELLHHPCNSCNNRKECNFCPALFLQENGSFQKPSDYLCEITKRKHGILEKRGIL